MTTSRNACIAGSRRGPQVYATCQMSWSCEVRQALQIIGWLLAMARWPTSVTFWPDDELPESAYRRSISGSVEDDSRESTGVGATSGNSAICGTSLRQLVSAHYFRSHARVHQRCIAALVLALVLQ